LRLTILSTATKAFKCTFVAAAEHTVSAQGVSFRAHMDFEDAHDSLEDFDIVVIPGGSEAFVLDKKSEPLQLIKAFTEMQVKDPSKERTLLALSGGSLFLAQEGVLQGFGATTHPDYYAKLEILCQDASRRGDLEKTDVMEERYVVNNARFALDENEEENPFILRKRPDGRRKSIARKGSNAWKESNTRRESIIQRASMRLGGLRVITSGGGTAALDASLYLVSAMISHDSAEEVARILQYQWIKGVVVESIDV
jgi:putative intracellular protease/amidase